MDAIEKLDLLAKGSFPPKPKGDDDDENGADPDESDDQDSDDGDPSNDDGDPSGDDDAPSEGMGDPEESADGDEDGIPDDAETDNLPPGEGDDGDGNDDPDSLESLDADGDGDIDPDDAASLGAPAGGDLGALASQLIEAERNYYAAVGHKGHSNHNTVRLLEIFHKLLRKFVRAATSGQVQDDAAPPEQDGEGIPESDDAGDPDGDGFPDEEDDRTPPRAKRAMEKALRAFGAKHGLGVLVGVEPFDTELRKGTYDFRDTDNMAEIPEQFFMPYLVAFVEAAYSECCRGTDAENSPDKSAAQIMLRLVTLIPRATNLRRVATKYSVTEKSIAKILKDKGIITIAQAAADKYLTGMTSDTDGLSAAGAETMLRSQAPGWAQLLPESADLHPGGSRLRLADRSRPAKIVDDRGAVMRVPAMAVAFDGRNELVKANVHSLCRIHSPVDMRKTDTLTHAFGKCTCPR